MGDKAGRDFEKKARNIVCGLAVGFIAGAFLLYRFDPGAAADCTALFAIGIALLGFALVLSVRSRDRGWLRRILQRWLRGGGE
jgi:hypothetical protein